MPIIALVGNKGGAGKTTLSINLAAGLSRHASTAILDADPQGSSLQWRAITDSDSALQVIEAEVDLAQQAVDVAAHYDNLVVDCPPSVHAPQLYEALSICDVALIPVQPSPIDLWATVHIERAVEQAREKNTNLKAYLVINQMEIRTTLSHLVREALTEIGLPVTKTAVRRRAIYRTSALEGRSVYEMGRRGADAANELDNIINEVMIS